MSVKGGTPQRARRLSLKNDEGKELISQTCVSGVDGHRKFSRQFKKKKKKKKKNPGTKAFA